MTIADAILAVAVAVTISGFVGIALMLRYLRRSEPSRELPKF